MTKLLKTKSPLSYFGSDASVAARIGRYFDSCSHVTIPFVGGASILPHLNATRIVANDLNEAALNFYRCASGQFGGKPQSDLISLCCHTLSHPGEVKQAISILSDHRSSGMLKAWAYWALCWVGRGGQGGTNKITKQSKPSFRMSPSGGSNASRLRSAADDLEAWAKQFERCEWSCMDFRELLRKVKWDNPKCGVYIDAPWVHEGDAYLHSFTEQDHDILRQHLPRYCKCKILVRYGDCPLIRDLYDDTEWHYTTAKTSNQANNAVNEIWITNYDVSQAA